MRKDVGSATHRRRETTYASILYSARTNNVDEETSSPSFKRIFGAKIRTRESSGPQGCKRELVVFVYKNKEGVSALLRDSLPLLLLFFFLTIVESRSRFSPPPLFLYTKTTGCNGSYHPLGKDTDEVRSA